MQSLSAYLADLERAGSSVRADQMLLWPRTPIGTAIQDRIRERVGVSDLDVHDRRSRPARIGRFLQRAVQRGVIPRNFTALDIACGDALILLALRRRFAAADCFGVDLNVDAFPTHVTVRAAGVRLYRVALQNLFTQPPPTPLDVVLMLNTYRSWEAAELAPQDADLPKMADEWIAHNSRLFVTTLVDYQASGWRSRGFEVIDLGRGEDESRLACVTRARSLRRRALLRWPVRHATTST